MAPLRAGMSTSPLDALTVLPSRCQRAPVLETLQLASAVPTLQVPVTTAGVPWELTLQEGAA